MAENATLALNATESKTLDETVADMKATLEILLSNVDAFFLIVMGVIVFLMQCGFAFLEAGSVRSKNTVNILIKNMLDAFIGGVGYWAIGWAIAYGPNGNAFIGGSNFFSYGMELSNYPTWFFQFVFAATAATIVSGSIAERCQFFAYFVYSVVITGWVYPVVSHWAWDSTGWLNQLGYHDFAGSGVVHLLGATCALVGCATIGARRGRFTKDGKLIDMPGHSVPLAALGGFILLFGFLAFNGGSQLSISNEGDPDIVGLAIVNTIIGGCGGGLTTLFINKALFGKTWSYLLTLNGALTGMVAQCAGCDTSLPWASLIIGIFGGLSYVFVHEMMLKAKLDDPLDAVAVHGGGGVTGLMMQPFFAYGTGIFWTGNTSEPWLGLAYNIAGCLAIFAWSATWSLIIFGGLKWMDLLRINRDIEFRGMDMAKHGEPAYPVDAWAELQYDSKKSGTKKTVLGPMMQGTGGPNAKNYNNAFEMVPTAGGLFHSLSKNFSSFGGNSSENGPATGKNPDPEKGADNKAASFEEVQ